MQTAVGRCVCIVSSTRIPRAVLGTLLAVGALLAVSPAAHAFDVPSCNFDETWARPGLERDFEIYCSFTDDVRLAQAPAHGRLHRLEFDGRMVTWRYAADADAPADDAFTLELTGPAGTVEHGVGIHVLPASVNTPPVCDPVRQAQRTDGTGPVVVEFHVYCRDAEADEVTIDGGGPGTHLSTPIELGGGVMGGEVPVMRYRTAIAAGAEQATYWGTDVLGARSAEAPIDLVIGPTVDRRPRCAPNPTYGGSDVLPIFSRPDLVRRFALFCDDADGDPFVPRVVDPPSRGAFASFEVGPPQTGPWGLMQPIDVTYVPASSFEGDDPFSVRADGPHGEGPAAAMAIRTRTLPENGGAGCGWGSATTSPGVPVVLEIMCSDADGDPIKAAVTEGPLHGITEPPVVTPAPYGHDLVRVPYAPAPGFTGVDVVEVTVGDGHGLDLALPMEVRVDALRAPGSGRFLTWTIAGLTVPNELGILDSPAATQRSAVAPRDQARRLLGSAKVRLLRRIGDARLYALERSWRKPSVVALTCALRCEAFVERRVARGGRRLALRHVVAKPGRAARLDLRLTRAEHRAARRARRTRLSANVTVKDATGAVDSARLSFAIR